MQKLYPLLFFLFGISAFSQSEKIEAIPFGSMNNWFSREVKESFVIGGNTQTLYEIGNKNHKMEINEAYHNTDSPWATSTVMAKVKGITKASVTVFPEKRGQSDYAARLETKIEHVKVFGVLNIYVLASGTIFLGEMVEPITNTNNPKSKLIAGIPQTEKPHFVQFDYKVKAGGQSRKINGLTKGSKLNQRDEAVAFIILQKRWEDNQGNIHALRIGTGWERFGKTINSWQNKHRLEVHYGDISKESYFKDYMGLKKGSEAYYAKNSHGKVVPIIEEGWGDKNDKITHMFIQFSSSNGEPYVGSPDNRFWVDNVKLVY